MTLYLVGGVIEVDEELRGYVLEKEKCEENFEVKDIKEKREEEVEERKEKGSGGEEKMEIVKEKEMIEEVKKE